MTRRGTRASATLVVRILFFSARRRRRRRRRAAMYHSGTVSSSREYRVLLPTRPSERRTGRSSRAVDDLSRAFPADFLPFVCVPSLASSLGEERLHLRHPAPHGRELFLQLGEFLPALLHHLRRRLLDELGRLETTREPANEVSSFAACFPSRPTSFAGSTMPLRGRYTSTPSLTTSCTNDPGPPSTTTGAVAETVEASASRRASAASKPASSRAPAWRPRPRSPPRARGMRLVGLHGVLRPRVAHRPDDRARRLETLDGDGVRGGSTRTGHDCRLSVSPRWGIHIANIR